MSVELHLGDCLDVLRGMADGSVDAVVTDPPYGVNLGRRTNNNRKRAAYASTTDTVDDLSALIATVMPEMQRVARRIVLTPGVRNLWLWPKPDHVGAIHQPAGTGCNSWGFSCWQPVFYYGKDPFAGKGSRPDSFRCTEAAEKNGHPCPKPIGLWSRLVERVTLPGETVLDPFSGSGTTGVACVMTGRDFVGCEIDPAYHAIARRRIDAAMPVPA